MDEQDDEDLGLTLLDEPAPRQTGQPNRRLRWELLLGLLILAAIAGWGAYDWVRSQRGLENYRIAQDAAAVRDWDKALEYYRRADDYRDAKQRAAEAATFIDSRNLYYEAAVHAAEFTYWLQAVNAIQAMAAIQPNYLDSAARYTEALVASTHDALNGTIALRPGASPPGLYQYTQRGWLWLPGSDAQSSIRSVGPCDRAIYDTPASPTDPKPTTPDTPGHLNGGELPAGRRIHAALLAGDRFDSSLLDFDPTQFSYYVCSKDGVMALRQRSYAPAQPTSVLDFYYQEFGSALGNVVALPGSTTVASFALAQDSLLVTTPGTSKADGGTYYMVEMKTSRFTRLFDTPGSPIWMGVSPDGTRLLTSDFRLAQNGRAQQIVTMVDLGGEHQPVVLGSITQDIGTPSTQSFSAQFISSGPLAGKALLSKSTGEGSQVWLVDDVSPGKVLWRSKEQSPDWYPAIYASADGVLISWRQDDCASSPATVTLVDRNYAESTLDLSLTADQFVQQSRNIEGRLVYAIDSWCGASAQHYSIASAPRYFNGGAPGKAVQLYSEDATLALPQGGSAWAFGPRLLAYIKDGDLHARSYDGLNDALLEKGVTALYRSQPFGAP